MQARFNIERERSAKLFLKSYKNDSCVFQFHSQIEVYFVEEGEMEMLVDGKRARLTAPAVSVATSYVTHAYKTPESSSSSVMLVPAHICAEFTAAMKEKRLASPYVTDGEGARELIELYSRIKNSGDNPVKQLGYIYTLLGRVLDLTEQISGPGAMDADLAKRILLYVDENYAKGISPVDIAQNFGYSQSYISRYFTAAFGTTLSHYITSVRLRSAIALMHEGKHDVTYCAMESGFASMRTFYRSFRREYGLSPSEFMKENS